MIIERNQFKPTKPIIDLAGPDGNAFMLIGKAKSFAKQLGLDSTLM